MLIAGITLPFTFVGVLNLLRVWNIGRAQLDNSVKQQAELAALAFQRWVDAQREPLETIASIAADGKIQSLASEQYIVKTRPHWIDLTLVDDSGAHLRSYPTSRERPPSALIAYLLSETRKRQSWFLTTDRTLDESRPVVGIASPIKTGGAVIARIDGGTMNDLFSTIQLPGNAVIAVFDSQGRLLFRKQSDNKPLPPDVNSYPLFGALGTQRVAVAELRSPYDDIRRVYGLCRVEPTDFVIAVGVPSATLYEPMQHQFMRYALFSFLAVACAVVAAILMQRKIVRPIHRLSSAAHALGKGDFSASAPANANSEIGDLGAAFNSMAQEIKEREERLTELDRLKSEFVSSVSHELRTPLTTIKTLTHVLKRVQTSEAERQEYLETIAAECDRQIDLVTNLLDLSRIESGKYRVELSPVDAVMIVSSCARVARVAAETRQQEIRTELPADPVFVLADGMALQRVIRTVLENAIKHTPDQGTIVLGLEATEAEVRIFIKDSGSGIDSEDLPHIFERFYQGRAVAIRERDGEKRHIESEQTGVGLGLYVVRGLVGQLGGKITVESEAGSGSKFTIHLLRLNEHVVKTEIADAEPVVNS